MKYGDDLLRRTAFGDDGGLRGGPSLLFLSRSTETGSNMSIAKDPKYAPSLLSIIVGRLDCLLVAIIGPIWRGSKSGELDLRDFIERC